MQEHQFMKQIINTSSNTFVYCTTQTKLLCLIKDEILDETVKDDTSKVIVIKSLDCAVYNCVYKKLGLCLTKINFINNQHKFTTSLVSKHLYEMDMN